MYNTFNFICYQCRLCLIERGTSDLSFKFKCVDFSKACIPFDLVSLIMIGSAVTLEHARGYVV